MTVYVDEIRDWPSGKWCHMTADSEQELHAMADSVGLKRRWFQGPPKHSFSHYDLRPTKRLAAIRGGAIEITSKEMVIMARQLRERKE